MYPQVTVCYSTEKNLIMATAHCIPIPMAKTMAIGGIFLLVVSGGQCIVRDMYSSLYPSKLKVRLG